MYFFYNFLLFLLFIILLPVFVWQMFKGKYRKGLAQRFGFLPKEIVKIFKDKPTIWIHAVSVGETVAASSVVKRLAEEYPAYQILFSTVTDTGQEMARKIIKEADAFIYFPLDFSFVVKRVLNLIKPQMVILTETELWPNFLRWSKMLGIKTVLINGRISDKSSKGYKFLGPLLRDMLNNLDILSMQSKNDLDYVLKLGADSRKVYNTGNTKFDQSYAFISQQEKRELQKEFKIEEQPVLLVGSTHPGEEEIFLNLYGKLKERFSDLIMILAPRHIERIKDLEKLFAENGYVTIRRTAIAKREREEIILLDTIGELASLYSIADLVFVGGSLVKVGGHNVLEPAAQGKAVFFGPYMFNFKASRDLLLENGAGVQVNNPTELMEKIIFYFNNTDRLNEMGKRAYDVVNANKGAAERNVKLIIELIKKGNNFWR